MIAGFFLVRGLEDCLGRAAGAVSGGGLIGLPGKVV